MKHFKRLFTRHPQVIPKTDHLLKQRVFKVIQLRCKFSLTCSSKLRQIRKLPFKFRPLSKSVNVLPSYWTKSFKNLHVKANFRIGFKEFGAVVQFPEDAAC